MANHMARDREQLRPVVSERVAEALFGAPLVLVVLLFAVVPVAILLVAGVAAEGGVGAIGSVAGSSLNAHAIDNSLEQGALSASLAVLLGYPTGVALGRYEWPGRSAIRGFLLIPFLLPSLVVVLGLLDLFGSHGWASQLWYPLGVFGRGIPGIVAANLVFNVSIVALLTAVGAESRSPSQEATVATLGGSPARAYRDVWGPATWMGAAAGGLLTFVFSALSFAPPLLLCGSGARCYTLEVQIYALDQSYAEPNVAAVLALVTVLLLAVPTALYLLLVARMRRDRTTTSAMPIPFPWRSPLAWALLVETLFVVVGVALLLAAILWSAIAPTNAIGGGGFPALFGAHTTSVLGISALSALGNTLFFAAVGASIVLLVAVVGGRFLVASSSRATGIGFLLFLPLLFSPVVVAFALANLWRPILGGESMVWVLVILSQTTLALPFAIQSFGLPLRRLSSQLRDSARLLGASAWVAYLDADLPRARAGFFTAALFAFAFSLGEFTATYFLVTPTFTTLSVAAYRLEEVRLPGLASAAAGLLLIVSALVFALLILGGRRVEL
jgi:thiamine transport system permease protein